MRKFVLALCNRAFPFVAGVDRFPVPDVDHDADSVILLLRPERLYAQAVRQ